ncbi:hypothetical protein F0U59_49340 [Archangium gephyra]|nr:hypothetical protein F0U59_49340 [Archangium gephyra]
MHVAIRQLFCAMVAVGMCLVPGMGSAQELAQAPAQARTGEKSARLAQFEKDVAQLRALQGVPATLANTGMSLSPVSPSTLLDGRISTDWLMMQQPFVVWLQNTSTTYFTTILYWQDVNSSTVHQTSAGVSGGQVVPHITSTCGTVIAYLLDVYANGAFVASTGANAPDATDGDPCADAWSI